MSGISTIHSWYSETKHEALAVVVLVWPHLEHFPFLLNNIEIHKYSFTFTVLWLHRRQSKCSYKSLHKAKSVNTASKGNKALQHIFMFLLELLSLNLVFVDLYFDICTTSYQKKNQKNSNNMLWLLFKVAITDAPSLFLLGYLTVKCSSDRQVYHKACLRTKDWMFYSC